MSEFLLIAPSDWLEYDLQAFLAAAPGGTVGDSQWESLQRGVDMHDYTDGLRAAGLIDDKTELAAVKYFAEQNKLWVKFSVSE